MIVQKEFLSKLTALGINSYEAKLWSALLSRGISTAGELSDIAGVPRSRSYDVLESLEKKGFVIMKLGKPIKYIAVKPSEVLERVKQRMWDDAEASANSLDKFKDSEVLEELTSLHNKGIELVDPAELSGSFKGRSNLYAHIDSLLKSAEKSIIIATTSKGLIRKADNFRRALYRAKEMGVKVKIVAPLTAQTKEAQQKLSEYAEIKHVDKPIGRFIIVDDAQLTFMLLDDEDVHPNYDSGIWINSPFFSTTMVKLFETAWAKYTTKKM